MKKILLLLLSGLAFGAVAAEISVDATIQDSKCEEIAAQSVEIGQTKIGGNGYHVLKFNDQVTCYKYDAALPKNFRSDWNPMQCECRLHDLKISQ